MEDVTNLFDEYMMSGDAIRDKYSYEEYKEFIRKIDERLKEEFKYKSKYDSTKPLKNNKV